MRKILICLFATSIMAMNTYAEEISTLQIDGGEVTVSGQWNNVCFLNIEVIPYDYNLNTADERVGEKCILFSIHTDLDGAYNTEFEFPETFEGGKYTVHISDGTEEQTKDLFYVNEKEMQLIIRDINNKNLSLEEFKALALDNAEKFGIDKNEFFEHADTIIAALYNSRGGYSVDSYFKACRAAIATEKLKTSAIPDLIIKENASAFGIDFEKDYEICSNEEKISFLNKYINADISSGEYQKIFKKTLISTRLQNCNNYTQYGNVVMYYADFLNIDLISYNQLKSTQKSIAFSKLYDKKVSDIDEIARVFKECITLAAKSDNTISNGGSSGGGSGGGGNYGKGNTAPGIEGKPSVLTSSEDKNGFSDISGHWAVSYIEELVNKGIVSGFPDGTFKPDDTVTRSQFVKMIATSIGLKAVNEVIFEDVSAEYWNCGNITAASKAGIVSGFDGKFMPDNKITRQDCAVIIYNSLKYKGSSITGSCEFSDKSDISDYATEAVGALNSSGIVNGYTTDGVNIFNPNGSATRAEAVKMITNFIRFIEEG